MSGMRGEEARAHKGEGDVCLRAKVAGESGRQDKYGVHAPRRGTRSGVITSRLRHMGQSTDSCQPPHALWRREKKWRRMQSAQKVWPHWPGLREYGWAMTS